MYCQGVAHTYTSPGRKGVASVMDPRVSAALIRRVAVRSGGALLPGCVLAANGTELSGTQRTNNPFCIQSLCFIVLMSTNCSFPHYYPATMAASADNLTIYTGTTPNGKKVSLMRYMLQPFPCERNLVVMVVLCAISE